MNLVNLGLFVVTYQPKDGSGEEEDEYSIFIAAKGFGDAEAKFHARFKNFLIINMNCEAMILV